TKPLVRQFVSYQVSPKTSHKRDCGMLHTSSPTKLGMPIFFVGKWVYFKQFGVKIHNIHGYSCTGLFLNQILGIVIVYNRNMISIIGQSMGINRIIGNSNSNQIGRNRVLMPKVCGLVTSINGLALFQPIGHSYILLV